MYSFQLMAWISKCYGQADRWTETTIVIYPSPRRIRNCYSGAVVSEYHYLFDCSFFNSFLAKFIEEEFLLKDSSTSTAMEELFNSKDILKPILHYYYESNTL